MFGESANLATLRQLNAHTVLGAIEARHPVTRADVARLLGMPKPTVANALDLLLETGLVRETDRPDGAHYASVFFEPAPDVAYVVAVDAGTQMVRGVLADLRGTPVGPSVRVAIGPRSQIAGRLRELRRRLGTPEQWGRVALGVAGVPGLVDAAEAEVRHSSTEPWEGFPIAHLTEILGVPTEVENDINLAALGEQWRGAGRDVSDFAFLSIGAGVGAGLILSNRLHRGFHGAAGEVDFPVGGRRSRPTSPAAFDLIRMTTGRLARWTQPTVLAEPVTPKAIFKALHTGDRLADQIVGDLARRIARLIEPVAQVVDIDLVVLGGGIGANHEVLVDRVRPLLARASPYPPRVQRSRLGDDAVLTGALSVAVTRARSQVVAQRLRGTAVRTL